MHTFLDFALHEVDHSFGKIFVKVESFGVEIVVNGPLDEFVGINNISLPNEHLCYLKKGVSAVSFMELGIHVIIATL